jgi:hypothetical protein
VGTHTVCRLLHPLRLSCFFRKPYRLVSIVKESELIAMEQGGNTRVNAFFEARVTWSNDNIEKPNASTDMELRKQFVYRKYEQRQFYLHGVEIPPSPPPPPPKGTAEATLLKNKRVPPSRGRLLRQMSMPVMGSPKLDLFARFVDPTQLMAASTVLDDTSSPPQKKVSSSNLKASTMSQDSDAKSSPSISLHTAVVAADSCHERQARPKQSKGDGVDKDTPQPSTMTRSSSRSSRGSRRHRDRPRDGCGDGRPDSSVRAPSDVNPPDATQHSTSSLLGSTSFSSSLRSQRRTQREQDRATRDAKQTHHNRHSDETSEGVDATHHSSASSSVRSRSSSRSRKSQRSRRPPPTTNAHGDSNGDLANGTSGSEHSRNSTRRSSRRPGGGRSDPNGSSTHASGNSSGNSRRRHLSKTLSSPDLLSPVHEPLAYVTQRLGIRQSRSPEEHAEDKTLMYRQQCPPVRRTDPPGSGAIGGTGTRSSSRSRRTMKRQSSVPSLSSHSDHGTMLARRGVSKCISGSSQISRSAHNPRSTKSSSTSSSSTTTNRRNIMARQASVPALRSSSPTRDNTKTDPTPQREQMQHRALTKASSAESRGTVDPSSHPSEPRTSSNSVRSMNARRCMMLRQSSVPSLPSSSRNLDMDRPTNSTSADSIPQQRGGMNMKKCDPQTTTSAKSLPPPQRVAMMKKSTAADPIASTGGSSSRQQGNLSRAASHGSRRNAMARQLSVPVLRSGGENLPFRQDRAPAPAKKAEEHEPSTSQNKKSPMSSFLGGLLSPGTNQPPRNRGGLSSLHKSMPQLLSPEMMDDDIVSMDDAWETSKASRHSNTTTARTTTKPGQKSSSVTGTKESLSSSTVIQLNSRRVLTSDEQAFLRILHETYDSAHLTDTPGLDQLRHLKRANPSSGSNPEVADDDDDMPSLVSDVQSLVSEMPSLTSEVTWDSKSVASEMPSLCSVVSPPQSTLYGLPFMPFKRDEF